MLKRLKDQEITYIFYLIAVIIVLGSFVIYTIFNYTSNKVKEANLRSDIEYIENIATNISEQILAKTSNDVYAKLKQNKDLRKKLEESLQLFITKRYRYIYIVDKKCEDSDDFRFLLDGTKVEEDKSEFEELYTPLNPSKWNSVYKSKKSVYFEHKDIKSIWLTYLKPIVVNDKVVAIVVVDFSLKDHQIIKNTLQDFDDFFLVMLAFSIFIFLIIVIFAYIDKQRIAELRKKSKEIKEFNATLKLRIDEEVEKNREKDKQLLQQSRLAQMGEMISMIAHQWRQPLNAISATSQAIILKASLNKLDNNSILEFANKIFEYSKHLSLTIDDFRNFYKQNKEKKEVSCKELIDGVLSIIEVSVKNKNIDLIVNIINEAKIETYDSEVKQVLLNLIKNAEDVLIEREIEDPKIIITANKNIITVEDNAGGIEENIISKVFDPYFSTKTKKDGTGLGLYMSKMIIEEHCEGKLTVENTQNGALFKIVL